ncbi:hypothetical protein Poli38472_001803 [Pythium oligandrum]|uniref:Non-specific serine/threonine protein kinase n=1 Tax=Pythium oligandrum TaxID=41045 RepID=A0A8K1FS43_PYTOL|nr:hypothetical protein Poli38472_001803 [Pythium oligandrum]|eukprot:TMW69647.1 hypothetical protein Poli38472_001803 [Pythium oligandrum]
MELLRAVQKGDVKQVERLLKRADVGKLLKATDCGGKTVLHVACSNGRLDVVKKLVAHGAALMAVDSNGETVLPVACEDAKANVVTFLLSQGLDVNAVDETKWSVLHSACDGGDLDIVKLLLAMGADLNALDEDEKTVLHAACQSGNEEVARYLLNRGLDPKAVDNDGYSVLHSACEGGDVDLVKLLLAKGVDINAKTKDGTTVLHTACEEGSSDVVMFLLERGMDVNAVNDEEYSVLHAACEGDDVDIVELLLDQGANLNAVDKDGKTVLHAACKGGDTDVVKFLLSRGLSPTSVDNDGYSALHSACEGGDIDVFKLLLKKGADLNAATKDGTTLLHTACEEGSDEVADSLIARGADVNAVDKEGNSVLHAACEGGDVVIVKKLVKKGASLNAVDEDGKTVLHFACKGGDKDVVQLLLTNGADLKAVDKNGFSVMHSACEGGDLDVVKLLVSKGVDLKAVAVDGRSVLHGASGVDVVKFLLESGLDVNSASETKWTPLHTACEECEADIVKVLLEAGADINAVDEDDFSVLHSACEGGDVQIIKMLVEKGANLKAVDSDGRTVLHIACNFGSVDAVKHLLELGVDINAVDNDGWSVLHFASESGNKALLELLMLKGLGRQESLRVVHSDQDGAAAATSPVFDAYTSSKDGQTVLHSAAKSGNVNVVNMLLSLGMDSNIVDNVGDTPLHAAASEGNAAVVQVLLNNGANASAANEDGYTVLQAAAVGGSIEAIEALLAHDADPCTLDNDGWNVLHFAAFNEETEALKFFLNRGMDANTSSNEGNTPVHAAARSHHYRGVDALIGKGCHLNLRNKSGKTPLNLCVQWHEEVAELYASDEGEDDFLSILQTAYSLMSRGATYEAVPGDFTPTSSKYQDQAKIVELCVKHWAEEQKRGKKTITQLPPEVFMRGVKAVQTYLDEINASSDSDLVLRRKVCVIGSSKTGKSSLIKSITTMEPILVAEEDRTIGVDLHHLEFVEVGDGTAPAKNHQITFWDFAGQDEYHVAHTLFFSRRTLYLLGIDTKAFAEVVDASRECDDDDEAEAMIDAFVKERVWRWFRLVFVRQPDAEFVLVATKVDALATEPQRVKELEGTLMGILQEYKSAFDREVNEEMKCLETRKESVYFTADESTLSARIDHLEHMRTRLNESLPTSWLPLDVTKANSIQDARFLIERVVTQSDRSFLMPDKYSRVLEKIQELREEPPHQSTKARIKQLIVPLPELREQLVQGVDDLEPEDCETILETLHDLGDILWYDRDGLGVLGDTVILSARLLIDLVRQIICHDPIKNVTKTRAGARVAKLIENMLVSGQVPHELMTTFTLWKSLEYPDQMVRFKKLLQHFQLAYPADMSSMEADSDLIVPTFWKLREEQMDVLELEPLGDKFRSSLPEPAGSSARVFHWEYDFHFEMVETLFEQLAVQSYSVFSKRTAARSCIESIPNAHYAIRLSLVKENGRQIIALEVAAVDATIAQEFLQKLYESLESVLADYPGITVTRYGVDEDGSRVRIDQVVDTVRAASPAKLQVLRSEHEWLPADLSWYKLPEEKQKSTVAPVKLLRNASLLLALNTKTKLSMPNAGPSRSWQNVLAKVSAQLSSTKLGDVESTPAMPAKLLKLPSGSFRRELRELVRGELDGVKNELKTKMDSVGDKLLQTSAGDGNHRDLPALWMVEYVQKPKARLILWILSEISGRCFHKPIEIAVSRQFLAKHGDKLQLGLSVFSSVLPDAPVVSVVKSALELASPELDNRLAQARSVHDLLGNLGLENGGTLNTSKQQPVSPAGMYGLLRALLKIHDPEFQPDKICDLAKLECGMVLLEGGYRWAHRHELLQAPDLYKLRVEYATDSVHSRGTGGVKLGSDLPGMCCLSDFRANGMGTDDSRLAYCTWEIVNASRSLLSAGETIQNPNDGDVQSWWQEAFVLSGMQSVHDLRDCELVVEVKRPSKLVLRSDRFVARGSVRLADVLPNDTNQVVDQFRIVVPLTKKDGSVTGASIECQLWGVGTK